MTAIKQTGTLLAAGSPNATERVETLLVTSPAATARGGLRLVSHARVSEIERVYVLLAKDASWVRLAHDAVISAGAMPEWVSSPSAMLTSARARERSYGVLITSNTIPPRATLPAGFRCLLFDPDVHTPDTWSRALGHELCRAELEGIWAIYQARTLSVQGERMPENLRIEPDTAPLPDAATIEVIWAAFKDVESGGPVERVRVAIVEGPSGSGKESVSRLLCLAWHRRNRRSTLRATSTGNKGLPGEHHHESMSLAALTDTLARSELIGIERGVGTDVDARSGIFERVGRGGSVHIDEVAKASESVQSAMLRLLSEGAVRREGGRQPIQLAPMFVALSTATGQHHKRKMLPDLRSRGRENVIELPSLAKFEPDALAGVVRWLAARHGVPFVSGAALRVFDRYRATEMRELGFAVRIAAERARARLGDVECNRYYIMACDVPIPPESSAEPEQVLSRSDQQVSDREPPVLGYIRGAIRNAARDCEKDPASYIQHLTRRYRAQRNTDGLLKEEYDQAGKDDFATGVIRELWNLGETKITGPDFLKLLDVSKRTFVKSMPVIGIVKRRPPRKQSKEP